MILVCYYKGALAWAMCADSDTIAPAGHDGFTYVLEAA